MTKGQRDSVSQDLKSISGLGISSDHAMKSNGQTHVPDELPTREGRELERDRLQKQA